MEGGARPAGAGAEKILSIRGMRVGTVPICSKPGVRDAEVGRTGCAE